MSRSHSQEQSVPAASAAPAASIATAAQRRANRRNARRSTGPRTDAGKARSSRNAITHGMHCRDLILPGERRRDFLALRLGFHADLKATDSVEFAIVERAAIAQWRMRRAQSAEADLHAITAARLASVAQRQIDKIRKAMAAEYDEDDAGADAEELAYKADARGKIDEWDLVQADTIPAAVTMAADFRKPSSALERLARHEHRLEHHFYKALRELATYRKNKRANGAGAKDERDTEPYADIARMTQELLECPEEEDDEEDEQMDAEVASRDGGVVTSDFDELSRVVTMSSDNDEDENDSDDATLPNAPSRDAVRNEQNEPNSAKAPAGDDAAKGCDQSSCDIEVIAPTKLAPRPAVATSGDGKEDGIEREPTSQRRWPLSPALSPHRGEREGDLRVL